MKKLFGLLLLCGVISGCCNKQENRVQEYDSTECNIEQRILNDSIAWGDDGQD